MHAEDGTFFTQPVKIPLEDWLDLHTFPPGEIADLLEEYIGACEKAGFLKVRIIHGKGTGVLRTRVHECLQKNPLVERFYQAPPGAGGWGATIAVLRRSGR
jgi:dsDNA-specific endonuclease/ATPase MutS2